MAFLRNSPVLQNPVVGLMFIFFPRIAQACPACLTADTGGSISQRVWVIGMMGLFPLVLACIVGFNIYQICRVKSLKIAKESG